MPAARHLVAVSVAASLWVLVIVLLLILLAHVGLLSTHAIAVVVLLQVCLVHIELLAELGRVVGSAGGALGVLPLPRARGGVDVEEVAALGVVLAEPNEKNVKQKGRRRGGGQNCKLELLFFNKGRKGEVKERGGFFFFLGLPSGREIVGSRYGECGRWGCIWACSVSTGQAVGAPARTHYGCQGIWCFVCLYELCEVWLGRVGM